MDSEWVNFVASYLDESVTALSAFSTDPSHVSTMGRMAETICGSFRNGGKLMVAGNGGSAADAQHIAGEFISRLMLDRAPLPALALTVDSSILTAVGNDYGFEHVFERQVIGLARPGDVLLAISTSGRSRNVLAALSAARRSGLSTLGFSGADGGVMRDLCDVMLEVPSLQTAIAQQLHIVAAHIVCALVERNFFKLDT